MTTIQRLASHATRISPSDPADPFERQITVRPQGSAGVNVAIELWGEPSNVSAGLTLSTAEAGELVAAVGRALAANAGDALAREQHEVAMDNLANIMADEDAANQAARS